MRGPTHREWGAVTGALTAAAVGNDPLNVAVCYGMGYLCASFPDRIEEPFGLPHRGISHAWEVYAALAVLAWWLPPIVDYVPWGFTLACISHLTGDLMFGKRGWGRGAGIPWVLGTKHWGPNLFKVGNWTEERFRDLLIVVRPYVFGLAILVSFIRWAVPNVT